MTWDWDMYHGFAWVAVALLVTVYAFVSDRKLRQLRDELTKAKFQNKADAARLTELKEECRDAKHQTARLEGVLKEVERVSSGYNYPF